MSKTKAIICSALLSIGICSLYFLADSIKLLPEMSLYYFVACFITGMWTGDKIIDFYHWLRKDK